MSADTLTIIRAGRRTRQRRRLLVTIALALVTLLLCTAMLIFGNVKYPLSIVLRVLLGEQVQGATFAVGTLRLPRMLAGLLAGFSFGMAGSAFQTMLRNPLANPNVIGITSGSSAAAVFCILVLGASGAVVSLAAVVSGLITAALIYAFSRKGAFSGGRLILIGMGIQAMLNAVVSYLLLKGSQYDVPAAMRWLTGSLNGVQMKDLPELLLAVAVCSPVILLSGRQLGILELGEQSAATLGVNTDRARITLIIGSVSLIAFATAATGPIAFVSFLSGPIAKRLVGAGFPSELPAGLVGAVLTLGADLLGQFAFSTRFPAGVITGILGAPYLLYLLIRMNRTGELS